MILKTEILLRQGLDQEMKFSAEVIVDNEQQAEEAGTEFMQLALAFSNGIGKA